MYQPSQNQNALSGGYSNSGYSGSAGPVQPTFGQYSLGISNTAHVKVSNPPGGVDNIGLSGYTSGSTGVSQPTYGQYSVGIGNTKHVKVSNPPGGTDSVGFYGPSPSSYQIEPSSYKITNQVPGDPAFGALPPSSVSKPTFGEYSLGIGKIRHVKVSNPPGGVDSFGFYGASQPLDNPVPTSKVTGKPGSDYTFGAIPNSGISKPTFGEYSVGIGNTKHVKVSNPPGGVDSVGFSGYSAQSSQPTYGQYSVGIGPTAHTKVSNPPGGVQSYSSGGSSSSKTTFGQYTVGIGSTAHVKVSNPPGGRSNFTFG